MIEVIRPNQRKEKSVPSAKSMAGDLCLNKLADETQVSKSVCVCKSGEAES